MGGLVVNLGAYRPAELRTIAKLERWHSNAAVELSVHLHLNVYPKHVQLYLNPNPNH